MGEVEFVAEVSKPGSIAGDGQTGDTGVCNMGMDIIARGDC